MKSALPKLPTSLLLRPMKSQPAQHSRPGATMVAPIVRAIWTMIRIVILVTGNGVPAAQLRAWPTGWLRMLSFLRLNLPMFITACSLMRERVWGAQIFLSRQNLPRKQVGRLNSKFQPQPIRNIWAKVPSSCFWAIHRKMDFLLAFPRPLLTIQLVSQDALRSM